MRTHKNRHTITDTHRHTYKNIDKSNNNNRFIMKLHQCGNRFCFFSSFFLFFVYCFMCDRAFKDLTKPNKKEHEKNRRLFLLTKSLEWRHVLTSMSARWNCRKVLSEWLISSAFFVLQQKCVDFQVKIWYCHWRMERKGWPFQSVNT